MRKLKSYVLIFFKLVVYPIGNAFRSIFHIFRLRAAGLYEYFGYRKNHPVYCEKPRLCGQVFDKQFRSDLNVYTRTLIIHWCYCRQVLIHKLVLTYSPDVPTEQRDHFGLLYRSFIKMWQFVDTIAPWLNHIFPRQTKRTRKGDMISISVMALLRVFRKYTLTCWIRI